MLSSEECLFFHRLRPSDLSLLLSSIEILPLYIRSMSLYNPNYGPLWHRCCPSTLCTPKEVGAVAWREEQVLYSSVLGCANSVARDASLYFMALQRLSRRTQARNATYRKQLSYAFHTDSDVSASLESIPIAVRMKLLNGSIPVDD